TLTLTASTVSGNRAGNPVRGDGGGLFNVGTATVINCTFANNVSVTGTGGGIWNDGTLTIHDSTITGNVAGSTAADTAAGLSQAGGTLTLNNPIVAENITGDGMAPDVRGAVAASSSHNLIGSGDGLTGITDNTNGNRIGTTAAPLSPLLGPLQNN